MKRYSYNYRIMILIIFMFCVTCVSCRRREPESPFQGNLSEYDSIVTVISTDEVEQPIKEEPAEELEVMSIQIDDSNAEAPTLKQVQTALKNAGYYNGEVDGKIGPMSKEAILKFQKDNGLTADGKVGPKTWAKLRSHLNPQ